MNLDDPELLEREYATSERLERRRHDVTGWVRGEEPWIEALAAVAETRPRRVLDAGCGDGVFARAVAAPVVVAVDMAAPMVEQARSRGVDARRARIEDLPFADGEFDVVVCNWVLYHLPDVDAGVRELARVLRPGGRFVGIYNRDGHMGELWDRLRPASAEGDDYHDVLARHFARVEERDTNAHTLWRTRGDLQTFLDASVELLGPLEAPAGPYPFTVTRRNRVYVAEKAR
ncbi:MAG TPA: methyltransferase domain-containing protein [Gaiellaceae bacterium]|nr:methyltransferase domain-containing protein [Gaiellaceae bacterium]